jgi:hypothetical protein
LFFWHFSCNFLDLSWEEISGDIWVGYYCPHFVVVGSCMKVIIEKLHGKEEEGWLSNGKGI